MNPNKSVRSNVPSIHFVKLSAKIISPYLSKLYKKSVKYGVFPESLKYAEVVPIYKNGKKNDVTIISDLPDPISGSRSGQFQQIFAWILIQPGIN